MQHMKKALPVLLFFVVVAIGGISVSQAVEPYDGGVQDAPQCTCRTPNNGGWGVFAPDPENPGEQMCEIVEDCWIRISVE